jgi:hypothetical protein
MNTDDFRTALAALLRLGANSGLDIFWLHQELSLAGAQLIDDCRTDLVECDEGEPTF